VLDDQVKAVLARLEAEDVRPPAAPTTGRFLFTLVAPQTDCEVLEVGAGRGYSTIWLGAGIRYLGGRVLSLEKDPEIAADWRRNVEDAGLADWVELIEGDALETIPAIPDVFDVAFLDGKKDEYELYFDDVRPKLEPAALVVADNVLSHSDELGPYVAARHADPTLLSVTVPLDRGLELTAVLSESV
jgi:predicted O-methyltransferase YrrM